MLYKLQSNRFYKNTLVIRKAAQEEGMRRQTAFFVLFPPKFGAIVGQSLPPPEQLN
jgi:hypothetical protein